MVQASWVHLQASTSHSAYKMYGFIYKKTFQLNKPTIIGLIANQFTLKHSPHYYSASMTPLQLLLPFLSLPFFLLCGATTSNQIPKVINFEID